MGVVGKEQQGSFFREMISWKGIFFLFMLVLVYFAYKAINLYFMQKKVETIHTTLEKEAPGTLIKKEISRMNTTPNPINSKNLLFYGMNDKSNKKYIIVTFPDEGGIGNQLFVYAAAVKLKRKLNMPILIVANGLSKHSNKDHRDMFRQGTQISRSTLFMYYLEGAKNVNLQGTSGNIFVPWDINTIQFDTSNHIIIKDVCLQNFPSIQDIIPEVTSDFVPKLETLYKNMVYNEHNTLFKNTCAFIHIRRGDYLTHGGGIALQSFDYYKTGYSILMKKYKDIKYTYIFSDDIEWCKEQEWPTYTNTSIVFADEPNEFKTLYMMSLCTGGAVISASTFSSWGAFFGAYQEDRLIVYPSRWWHNNESIKLPESEVFIKI